MSDALIVVGLSHHTAPISLRERLAVGPEKLPEELRALAEQAGLREALLVSTCNRVEVYGVASDPLAAGRAARAFLGERAHPEPLEAFLYERLGEEAVRHAFRVASSLDSMVLGEPQILGQVKDAYAAASAAGSVGTLLGRCFTRAFAVAKRVRTETGITAGTVSVSSIASELALQIFGDLVGKRVLLVGAGKMSESAARHLRKKGARLFVVNRSPERAEELAKAYGGEPRPYEQLGAELMQADVVITSTASPRFVITTELMAGVVKARRHRPLFLIDIAVPRDVDPRVGELENVFLYDIDDLQRVSDENLQVRQREAQQAERIVESEVREFEAWRRSLDLTPTIVALRERFRAVVRAEVERSAPKLGLDETKQKSLDAMAEAIVNKLLHHPLTELRRTAEHEEGPRLIAATRRLFDIDAAGVVLDATGKTQHQREAVPAALTPAPAGKKRP